MKVAINIEFTAEELVKHGEDLARRISVNFLSDAVKAGGRFKIDPSVKAALAHAVESAFGPKPPAGVAETIPPHAPPPQGSFEPRTSCERVEGHACPQGLDEGWICCECSVYNALSRETCRNCKHARCDVVVPPAPADPSAH